MAELDDTRESGVHPSPDGTEPTQVLPTTEPTQAFPQSPWARPADVGGNWAAPDATTRFDATTHIPTQPVATGWQSAGQQPYFRPGSGQPTSAQPVPAPTSGQPTGQPPYVQQPYGQTPNRGYYQQGYYGQHNQQGYPQQYAPQQYAQQPNQQYAQQPYGTNGYYYPQPTPPTPPTQTKKRWPIALVAMLAAFVLVASGSFWAAKQLDGATPSSTRTTQPTIEPYVPTEEPTDEPTVPSGRNEEETGGSVTSNGVSAAQSAGVVLIEAETASGTAAGTGMILTESGKVLTNYHVVAGSTDLSVTDAVSGNTYAATVLGFDQTRDVAVLQLTDASGLTTVNIDDDQVQEGDEVAAVGNANGGGELVEAPGQVTGTDQDLTVSSDSPWGNTEDLTGLIETDAGAVPGDSGGPMFDAENEVLGMTTAGSTREGTSYAVPIATALAVVDQVASGTDAGTVRVGPAGFLGIKVADADQRSSGKTITEVVADSPAEEAGVKAGSTLTRVGDTAIKGSTNLATVIRALEPGQQVTIAWTAPNGSAKEATVTLGSSPVN